MLIRFRVRNFLSFKDEVEYSMLPGRTRQHPSHIIPGQNDINLLRAGVIYGANASGKSNFVKAIDFAKNLVIKGTAARKSIPITPFKLDIHSIHQPSKFEFELRYEGKDYLYGFEITSDSVKSEWLHVIKKTTTSLLFERRMENNKETQFQFDNIKFEKKKDAEFLNFVARGTRANQLFLTECIDREVHYFKEVYYWFEKLVVIHPHSRQIGFDLVGDDTVAIANYLEKVGTGVCGFDLQNVSVDSELPTQLMDKISKELKSGEKTMVLEQMRGQRYIIQKDDQGEITTSKVMLTHRMGDCNEQVLFDNSEESDGTIRLIDLIPILINSDREPRVFIIDELDRSLHPIICYQLIKDFLEQSNQSQLIVTTHEANLLTFDLLRRDEIWFVEKDSQGATAMYSLEEYAPRYDKDIQKGYLLGRFGAIPMIGKKAF